MKRILIVDTDEQFAGKLLDTLAARGDCDVIATPMMREACLVLAQRPQDLAFVSLAGEGANLVRSLRSMQPDLPLVVMVPQAGTPVPDAIADKVQGVLDKSALATSLPAVLTTLALPAGQKDGAAQASPPPRPPRPANTAILAQFLQKSHPGEKVVAALLLAGEEVVAVGGYISDEQAAAVAARVQETWPADGTAQLQFLRPPEETGDWLLYTRPVADLYLLTLTAHPSAEIGTVRRQADKLAAKLTRLIGDERTAAPPAPTLGQFVKAHRQRQVSRSFAIAWRPLEPLPSMIHIPLRRALERIAEANACVLTHLQVELHLVHIVVRCPPGRNSAWAAHLFKYGSGREIQNQFGVDTQLWDRGYYAVDAAEPLSAAELDLFLEQST